MRSNFGARLREEAYTKAIKEAGSREQCFKLIRASSSNTIKGRAMERALGFSTTCEQCLEIYDMLYWWVEIGEETLEKALGLADNSYECIEVADRASDYPEIQKRAFDKKEVFLKKGK